MHQEGSPNSMCSLELTSLSSLDNEIQPQSLEISSINYLLQQSTKLSSSIEKISPSTTTKNFEESDLVVGEIFPNKDEAFLHRKEGKRCPEIDSRWVQQEILALLKFRSEMNTAFRDLTLRSSLWEDISRKLKELGYNRNARQCEEKFVSIQRHRKRTKAGRAGEAGRKMVRSCSSSGQLEALHKTNNATSTPFVAPVETNTVVDSPAGGNQPTPILTVTPSPIVAPSLVSADPTEISGPATAIANTSITLSSTPLSSEPDDGKVEGTRQQARKRKRGKGSRTWKSMTAFFEELTRRTLERQDAMQQKLLEAIEKGDRERKAKEDAWRRREMAKLVRDWELKAQQRATVALGEKALLITLEKITGLTIPIPAPSASTAAPTPQSSSPPQQQQQRSPQQQPSSDTELAIIPLPEPQEVVTENTTNESRSRSSRWPKTEVQELIKLRTSLEPLHPGGPKGPLWEKVSVGMQQLGYDRSAKKCKEKWENINKYFKRVKERDGRVENSRTCPYFLQLDAFHRSRSSGQSSLILRGGGASGSTALRAMSPPQLQQAGGGTTNESGHANDNNGHEENTEGDVGCGMDFAKEPSEDPSYQAVAEHGGILEEPDDENMAEEGEDKNEESEDE